ncbi:MAG TPA: cysteine synthase A [Candidatus Pullichristensenella excrementipullorum]|nr:cysteine synthase A [Candidatus Pullichristensenella excrementipullorum]
MSIVQSAEALIGNTPLLKLNRLFPGAEIYAKLEYLNPAGSAKDRAAKSMLNDLEARGLLKEGGTVVEPTSGNTGVALAALCAARGYRLVLTMPETMSLERRMLLSAYGAQLVLTPGDEGMAGAVKRADEIIAATPGAVLAGQFDNPANPAAHERTTGPELWSDLGGRLAAVVAGVGTGGTITGIARYLKRQDPAIRIIAVEPATSPLLSRGHAGPHGIMGIGANFVPKALDRSLLDDILTVTDEDARQMARQMARREGVLVGISSGAALAAAERAAKDVEGAVAVILPDGGERYLSTGLFEG